MWRIRCREVWSAPTDSWRGQQRDELMAATTLSLGQDINLPAPANSDSDDNQDRGLPDTPDHGRLAEQEAGELEQDTGGVFERECSQGGFIC
eukprot:gene23335-biopygen20812